MLNMHVLKITQMNIDLFITVMSASDLCEYCRVDAWSESYQGGYQRPLRYDRIIKAARYLLEEEGTFPTSILINVRGIVDFLPSTQVDNFAVLGVLKIPDSSLPLWVLDGQHRIGAISAARRESEKFENYAIPVSIFNFRNRYDEMRQFYIVNDRQKRIKTDLAQRHLYETVLIDGESKILNFEPKDKVLAAEAIKIVDYIRLHPDSPWYNKIQIPSDIKKGQNINTQTSVAKSIGYILRTYTPEDRAIIIVTPKLLANHIINYWNAIKEIYPEAFIFPQKYKLQKTFGCYVFHLTFPYVFKSCNQNNDVSQENMKDVLLNMLEYFGKNENVNATNSLFWHGKEGHHLIMGSGMQVIRRLYKKFIKFFE